MVDRGEVIEGQTFHISQTIRIKKSTPPLRMSRCAIFANMPNQPILQFDAGVTDFQVNWNHFDNA